MKATLLGTGSPPPNPKRRGPSTLLALGDERFLVDAGSGVGVQLVQAGVRPYDWPRVFITHHHSDHVIDLGHLLITRWIVGQNAPLEVWGPAGTRRQMDKLLDYLHWDIEVRRSHMHDRPPPAVTVTEVEEGRVMEAGGVTVSAFLVEHDPVKPAFGYRFEGGGRTVVISGDTSAARWPRPPGIPAAAGRRWRRRSAIWPRTTPSPTSWVAWPRARGPASSRSRT
jgi:ribonuclease Z